VGAVSMPEGASLTSRDVETSLRALRGLPDTSVAVFDRDLRYLLAVGPAVSDAGYDASAMPGRRMEDVLPADRWRALGPLYRGALAGRSASLEVKGHDARRVVSRRCDAVARSFGSGGRRANGRAGGHRP
jgi:hypothetical protein